MLKQGARCPEVGWGQPDVLVQGTLVKVPEETLAASPRPASPGHRCPHLVGRSRPPVQGMPARLASGAGDPAPAGPLTLQAPGSRAHAQRRAGAILSHRHRRPPLPWSRVCSEQSIAGRCASVPHGGVWHRKRVLSPAQRPPRGRSPGAQDCRDSALRGKGLRRSQEHLGRRAGSACEAVPLFGAGAGEPKWILQKVIKDDRWPCLWHSTKAISQNSRNVPQESPVPGMEAAGAGRRGQGRRGRVPSPLLTPVCASAQQQQ